MKQKFYPVGNRRFSFRAFTLIELLVVIAIIGLLASIILVSFKGVRDKARITKALDFSQTVNHTLGAYAVGIWSFDDCGNDGDIPTTLDDASGYRNNGTNNEAICRGDTPYHIIGQGTGKSALSFDGSNDYVDAGSASSLDMTGSDSISVSLWVNPSSLASTIYYPISKGWNFGIDGSGGVACGSPRNRVFVYYDGQSVICTEAGSELSINNWYHLAFTYANNTLKIYVNGIKRAERASYSFGDNSALSLFIGKRSVDGAWKFAGKIDEVRIYSQALTQAEIQKHYAEGLEKQQNLAKQ